MSRRNLTSSGIDPAVRELLDRHYPTLGGASWSALGNAGGFSGARLWRGTAPDGSQYCLRAWPMARATEERLGFIHSALAHCALTIVPKLIASNNGMTWVRKGDQFWEITTWLPGTADFHRLPSDARLIAAMYALAEIHRAWQPSDARREPSAAIERMIGAAHDWQEFVAGGWKPDLSEAPNSAIRDRLDRAWQALASTSSAVEFELRDWLSRPLPCQICLCDVWHDHILYEGDVVTGVIDFGAVKRDCVAVDLARLLGSLIPDEPERMKLALDAYSARHSVANEIVELVPALDRVGPAIGLMNWLRWICEEKRIYHDWDQVAQRMDALLHRLASKKPAFKTEW